MNMEQILSAPFARPLAPLSRAQPRKSVAHSRSGFLTQLPNQKVSGIAASVTRANLTRGGSGRLSTASWHSSTKNMWKM